MGSRAVNTEIMIDVLVDAAIIGDVAAAKKHEISRTTVWNYRNKFKDDPELSGRFVEALKSADAQTVAAKAEGALRAALDHLWSLVAEVESTPEGVKAVTDATRALAEIHFGLKLIMERANALNQTHRGPAASHRQVVAAAAGEA